MEGRGHPECVCWKCLCMLRVEAASCPHIAHFVPSMCLRPGIGVMGESGTRTSSHSPLASQIGVNRESGGQEGWWVRMWWRTEEGWTACPHCRQYTICSLGSMRKSNCSNRECSEAASEWWPWRAGKGVDRLTSTKGSETEV